MHPRQSIILIFSTFVQFNGDRFHSWATDSKLRRSIQSCVNKMPQETSENFWVLYWYNHIPEKRVDKLAKEHLIAYLQEVCYWTSQKTSASFSSTQYKLSDCFQMAIASVDKVLKGFNPNQGFILKNYASVIFGSVIRETLRQRGEIDICTEWGMLRKISQKRLVESLQNAGLSPETVTAYVLAWNCFKTLYVPKQPQATRQLSRPDNYTWSAIAQAYNSQSSQKVTSQILETWLLSCAKHARNYLYPPSASINVSPAGQDTSEWIDNLAGEVESVLTQIINQQEEQTRTFQQSEINKVLAAAIAQLESEAKQIFQLYYNQGMTQRQIAKELVLQQYTVSRRLTKARETLLRNLAEWSSEKLHISVTPDLLKNMSTVMEEWLQAYYSVSPH
jgi:RNA polymerase sigma factor (sigma-70 family)